MQQTMEALHNAQVCWYMTCASINAMVEVTCRIHTYTYTNTSCISYVNLINKNYGSVTDPEKNFEKCSKHVFWHDLINTKFRHFVSKFWKKKFFFLIKCMHFFFFLPPLRGSPPFWLRGCAGPPRACPGCPGGSKYPAY